MDFQRSKSNNFNSVKVKKIKKKQKNKLIRTLSMKSHDQLIKEPNDYFYKLNKEHELKTIQRKIKKLGLKNIAKRKNLTEKDLIKYKS